MTGDNPKELKRGFTTGAAAAAAAKAALLLLLDRVSPGVVTVRCLNDELLTVDVRTGRLEAGQAVCTVVKDAGDDPDVTHKAEIGARVGLRPIIGRRPLEETIVIAGGQGVGTVTKPGIGLPIGAPAINDGPRRMIIEAVRDVMTGRAVNTGVVVEIFAPEGRRLAEKTLNARLGIVGGLSILGTTGWVTPLSHEAYIATIHSAMKVARALGCGQVVMTTGRRSERFAQQLWPDLPEESFVQIGDFFQASCACAARMGFGRVALAVFFGKAVKMAQGAAHTHAAKAPLTLARLARWTRAVSGDRDLAAQVLAANTARHALSFLRSGCAAVIAKVGDEMMRSARRFAGAGPCLRGVIFDHDQSLLYDSGEKAS